MKHYLFNCITVTIILASSLFQGCSGHTLQDLIDGKSHSDSSSEEKLSTHDDPQYKRPSENRALNSISPASTADDKHKQHRYIQKQIKSMETDSDEERKKRELSVTESNITKCDNNSSSISHNSVDNNSSFTLQYYVDELGEYIDEKEQRDANKSKKPSHVEKLRTMPGIGAAKRRR